ncbi:hypothetical protein FGB62_243g018 [Gracilaria domingensis]|nr:hypothetical protein FGB62_243g018 [Gracilaria domingensis]
MKRLTASSTRGERLGILPPCQVTCEVLRLRMEKGALKALTTPHVLDDISRTEGSKASCCHLNTIATLLVTSCVPADHSLAQKHGAKDV